MPQAGHGVPRLDGLHPPRQARQSATADADGHRQGRARTGHEPQAATLPRPGAARHGRVPGKHRRRTDLPLRHRRAAPRLHTLPRRLPRIPQGQGDDRRTEGCRAARQHHRSAQDNPRGSQIDQAVGEPQLRHDRQAPLHRPPRQPWMGCPRLPRTGRAGVAGRGTGR